jgi:hypothetical protein
MATLWLIQIAYIRSRHRFAFPKAQDRVSLACDKAYQIRKLRYAEAPLIGLAAFQACHAACPQSGPSRPCNSALQIPEIGVI